MQSDGSRAERWGSYDSPVRSSGAGAVLPSPSASQGPDFCIPLIPNGPNSGSCAVLKPRLLNMTLRYHKDCCVSAPAPQGSEARQELYSKWCLTRSGRAPDTTIVTLLWLAVGSLWSFPSTDIERHECVARDSMLSGQPSPRHGALQLWTPSRLPVLAGYQ